MNTDCCLDCQGDGCALAGIIAGLDDWPADDLAQVIIDSMDCRRPTAWENRFSAWLAEHRLAVVEDLQEGEEVAVRIPPEPMPAPPLCSQTLQPALKRWFAARAVRYGVTLGDCERFDELYHGGPHDYRGVFIEETEGGRRAKVCAIFPGVGPQGFFANARRYTLYDVEAHGRVRLWPTTWQMQAFVEAGDPWPLTLPPEALQGRFVPRLEPIGPDFPAHGRVYVVEGVNKIPRLVRTDDGELTEENEPYPGRLIVSGAWLSHVGAKAGETFTLQVNDDGSYFHWLTCRAVAQVCPEDYRHTWEALNYRRLLLDCSRLLRGRGGLVWGKPHGLAFETVNGDSFVYNERYRWVDSDTWPEARGVLRVLRERGPMTAREIGRTLRIEHLDTVLEWLAANELVHQVERKGARGPKATAWAV